MSKEIQNKLNADAAQIEKIRQQIFTMANSYVGDDYGHIAQLLRGVCNEMITANYKMIVESVREPISAAHKSKKKNQTEGYLDLIAGRDEFELSICEYCGTTNNAHHSAACVDSRRGG